MEKIDFPIRWNRLSHTVYTVLGVVYGEIYRTFITFVTVPIYDRCSALNQLALHVETKTVLTFTFHILQQTDMVNSLHRVTKLTLSLHECGT